LTIKLLICPAAMLALSLLTPLPPLARQAVVLQAAAPTAVSALLLAEAAGRHQEATAHLVLWSTLLALLSVPAWWWGLSQLPLG
jgi:predicted permease